MEMYTCHAPANNNEMIKKKIHFSDLGFLIGYAGFKNALQISKLSGILISNGHFNWKKTDEDLREDIKRLADVVLRFTGFL